MLSKSSQRYKNSITGIYKDKWTEPEVIVTFETRRRKRWIEFHFDAPSYLPEALPKGPDYRQYGYLRFFRRQNPLMILWKIVFLAVCAMVAGLYR